MKVNLFIKMLLKLLTSGATALVFLAIVSAIPSLPTEFYGRVYEYNLNATPGGIITAYDSGLNLCGTFTIQNGGFYGTLTCHGDDPETSADEGAITNDNISFRYNSAFVTIDGDATWEQGVFKEVNITYPVVFCGDLFCDALHENSFTCPSDCPNTTFIPNSTTNTTSNFTTNSTASNGSSSSGTSSTSSSSSAGGGSSSAGPRITSSTLLFNLTSDLSGSSGLECIENWTCTNWTECSIDGLQNRSCVDKKACGTAELKPAESQQCVYTPTCSDKLQNGLEEGVDCGGLCAPCISCTDGVQNCHDGFCEEDVDCGGGCGPCNSCFDNVKNCHSGFCEQGIDCGGGCENICAEQQQPAPIFVCKKDINPINNEFFIFFAIIIFAIVFEIVYITPKIQALKRSKTQKGIERARKIKSLKTKLFLFITILLFIAIIIYLYYYMFILCDNDYRYAWWLILMLLLLPFLIHLVIKSVEYDEKKKEAKLKELLEAHENQIRLMIKIENESNLEKFNEINQILIENRDKFSEDLAKNSIESTEKLLETYSKPRIDLVEAEKDEIRALKDLTDLINSEAFKVLVLKEYILSEISLKVNELVDKQVEKKKMYDELKKIKSGQESNDIPDNTTQEKK